jgi:hypothetical protein
MDQHPPAWSRFRGELDETLDIRSQAQHRILDFIDAFAQTRERCLMAGMNDFLTKPVSPEKLSATLRRLFGAQGRADTPAAAPSGTRDTGQARADALAPLLDRAALDAAMRVMPRDRLSRCSSFFEQARMVQRLRIALRDGQVLDLRVNAHVHAVCIELRLGGVGPDGAGAARRRHSCADARDCATGAALRRPDGTQPRSL